MPQLRNRINNLDVANVIVEQEDESTRSRTSVGWENIELFADMRTIVIV